MALQALGDWATWTQAVYSQALEWGALRVSEGPRGKLPLLSVVLLGLPLPAPR